jgi:hypothetical protein
MHLGPVIGHIQAVDAAAAAAVFQAMHAAPISGKCCQGLLMLPQDCTGRLSLYIY